MTKTLYLLCLLAIFSTGCTSETPRPAYSTSAVSNRLDFIDSDAFDAGLSAAMRAGHARIYTTSVAPFDINRIPPRINRWLTAITKSGGSLSVEPRTRSWDTALWVARQPYEMWHEAVLYHPARDHHVILHYNTDTGKVRQLVFNHR